MYKNELYKITEELEKIKQHATVNKVEKSISETSIPKVISEKNNIIDQTI